MRIVKTLLFTTVVLCVGCVSQRQADIRFGVAVKASAYIAANTIETLHNYKEVSEETYNEAKEIFAMGNQVSIAYRDMILNWPQVGMPANYNAVADSLIGFLAALQNIVDKALAEKASRTTPSRVVPIDNDRKVWYNTVVWNEPCPWRKKECP